MLFSDFDIVSASVAGPALPSGGAGATVDVTTVNPPLVGAGEYCRAFSFQSPSVAEDSVGQVKMLVAEAAEYPANRLYAPDRNKAISLRAYVRLDRGSDPDALDDADNALALVGLTACTSSEYSGGYELVLQAKGSGATRSVGLVLRARQPSAFSSHAALLAARETLCTGTYALGAWYHIRLDVVPSGELARELTAFVSADNGANWTQVGQMRLSALEPGWRDGSEGANDFPGRNGLIVLRSGEAAATELYTHYVAAFDGRVESVDVNLPPSIDTIPATATATQAVVSLSIGAEVTKQDDELVFYSASLSNGAALPNWLSIDASTGALSGTAPSDAQGTVEITVTATNERGAAATRLVTLDVQPAESTPASLTLASAGVSSEPRVRDLTPGATVGIFSAVNPTGSSLSYSLVAGAGDNQYLSAQGNTLVLSVTPPDGTAQLVAWVKAQNAEGYYTQKQIIIPVLLGAFVPSISGSASITTEEGVGVATVLATYTADVSVTWSLSGDDAADFTIDSQGDLRLVQSPDFETKSSYTISVVATDDFGNSATQAVAVSVSEPVGPQDESFSSVSLLLKMDGDFTDSSQYARTVTANGNAAISTAESKYGTGSAAFDGSGDYLTTPITSELQLGTGDFTIEFWTKLSSRKSSYPALFSNYSSFGAGSIALFAGHQSSNTSRYQLAVNGTFPAIEPSAISVAYGVWTHIAVVRSGSTITLYINGVGRGISTGQSAALNGVGSNFYIGATGDSLAASSIDGFIDDFRVTKGVARYTTTFTPPDTHPTR